MTYCATFWMLGQKLRPTANDYALEAALLRREGYWLATKVKRSLGMSGQVHERARNFQRLARMKAWSEQQSSHQVKTQEKAA